MAFKRPRVRLPSAPLRAVQSARRSGSPTGCLTIAPAHRSVEGRSHNRSPVLAGGGVHVDQYLFRLAGLQLGKGGAVCPPAMLGLRPESPRWYGDVQAPTCFREARTR